MTEPGSRWMGMWMRGRMSGGVLSARAVMVSIGVLTAAIAGVGCSTRPANRPATYAVSGVVQASGSPVEGATVCFQGKEQGARSATGLTDAQGRYRLTTFTRGDGAPPGDYRVIVFKYKETPTVVAEGEYSPPTGPEPPPQHELPPKYATANTSGLEATVGTSSLEFNIDLQP